jgi:putative membrane protein
MRMGFALAGLLGAFSGACLVAWHGFGAVLSALALAGWTGLALIALYHFLPLGLCGLAWRALLEPPKPGGIAFLWFRWLRDSGNEILAVVPAAGELLGIRAMSLHELPLNRAAAATVVDLTVEMAAQVVFTLVGLALLALARPGDRLIGWSAIGAAVLALLAAAFAFAQRVGLFRFLERIAFKIAADLGLATANATGGVHEAIRALYLRRRAIAAAIAIHLTAWLSGVGEAMLCFWCMGVPASFTTVLVLESLTYAVRNAAFFVPGGIGVQEGGYLLLGATLGIGPEFALALSLMKRGREIVLGMGALALWQTLEGGALWRFLRRAR